jgi:hypothetical protein
MDRTVQSGTTDQCRPSDHGHSRFEKDKTSRQAVAHDLLLDGLIGDPVRAQIVGNTLLEPDPVLMLLRRPRFALPPSTASAAIGSPGLACCA